MTKEEAIEIIEACAESDYGSVGPSMDHTPAFHRSTLEMWVRNATIDDVGEAIDVLGMTEAVRVYREALDDAHADEYALDESNEDQE